MNMKTWFKGLGVFVASSLITSLAAANLSPATFNISKQGLMKLGTLAAVVGVKAVLLYLKQSPLPSPANPAGWSGTSGVLALAASLPAALLLSGCVTSWEQTAYTTLAAGKALIDCAVAGYNRFDGDIRRACAANPGDPGFDPSRFYIAQTREAQQAIEKARQAQIASVEAFEAYAVARVGQDKTALLQEKAAAVAASLAQLPALLNAVRALLGPASVPSAPRDPGAARNWPPASAAEEAELAAAIQRLSPEAPPLPSPAYRIIAAPDSLEVSHGW